MSVTFLKKIGLAALLFIVWISLLDVLELWAGRQAVIGLLAALGSFTVGVLIVNVTEWWFENKEEMNEI